MRTGQGKLVRRFSLASVVAALSLAASASPATASVTIGQTGTPSGTPCDVTRDRVQPAVTGGNSYVMPANGTITSWSMQTSAIVGDVKMKVLRLVSGNTWMVIGHDGPRTLAPNSLNNFSANVAVKPGDVLGLTTVTGTTDCLLPAPGDNNYLASNTDLADGGSAPFTRTGTTSPDRRENISAVLDPTNTITFGQVARNKKKGTARLTVTLQNPGQLIASGSGLKVAQTAAVTTVTAPGSLTFKIKAKGKKLAKLNDTGKVKVTPTFTFTPIGGDPNTESRKVKLKKRL